ncbi:hypothetical protein J6590_061279 [Homalodisca vitripennis]|nr:hypothetical protein J6590_061279 [Homalodisca vitripennis]
MNCHRNNTGNASVTELVTEKADKPLKRSDLDRRLLASSAPHAAETGTTFRMALNERHFTPVTRHEDLSSPEISPVVDESMSIRMKNNSLSNCKKTLHYYFNGDLNTHITKGSSCGEPVVNSTVIMNTVDSDRPCDMTLDCSIGASSVLPSSQDTGYQTEDSCPYHHSPHKLLSASTPTRR